MVKKYTDNYRLDIAYATIFRNLEPIEEISIHTALNITSGDNLTKKDMVLGTYIVYGGGGDTGNTHSEFNVDYKTIGIGRVGARCGCVFEIIPNSWVTDNALMIQSYDKRFSLDFLRHFLSYSDLGQYANNAMQPVISKTRIKDVTIPLIDIQEQNALSKILDSIEKNEKFESNDYDLLKSKIKIIDNWETLNVEIEIQNDLTAQLKQSILQEAIQGNLTAAWREENPNTESASELLKHIKAEEAQLIIDKKIKKKKALPPISEEDIPFGLPIGWIWCRLGDISENKTGNSINKQLKDSKYKGISDGLDYIGTKDVPFSMVDINYETGVKIPIIETNNSFKVAEVKSVFICIEGGSSGKKIGFVEKDVCYGNKLLACTPYIKDISKYFYYLFYSKHFQIEFKEQSKGLRGGVSVNSFKNIKIPIPPFKELIKIVKEIETLMQKCKVLERKIKTSEANAQMLLQVVLKEALKGKKRELVI